MPRPYASAVVPASAADVWRVVRAFDGLAGWHPGIATSELTSGSAAEVGAVRLLTLVDGRTVLERLVTLDDGARSYTYEILESPFAVRRYVATIRVAPVTDVDHAFMEWWAEYDADSGDENHLTALFVNGVFAAGIAALRERFS